MLALLLCLFVGIPRVSQFTSDVRTSSGVWLAGDGLADSTFLYDGTMTVKYDDKGNPTNLEAEFREALKGPPAFDPTTATRAPLTIFSDTEAFAQPSIDQGKSAHGYAQSYCVPFVVRGKDGVSRTYRINEPRLFGISGQDPRRLGAGEAYPVIGRHLAATRVQPSVWLLGGQGETFQAKNSIPGGRGTGNTRDLDRSVLWATIPATVPPGDYQLYIFHGENRWGISNPLPVTVVGPRPPPSVVDVQVSSGSTLDGLLSSAKLGSVLQIPPGQFVITKPTDLGGTLTIEGSGKNSTILRGSPSLSDDKSCIVFDRSPMLRLTGGNITFRDLTIELTPNTTRSAIAAGPGIDSVTFENVRFISTTPAASDQGYCDGFFYLFGLHRYWSFTNCEFECQQPFESRNGANNGFKHNGAFDNGLIANCRFRSVHGLLSGSLLCSCLGRGTLIWNNEFSHVRRGLALTAGDGSLESVVACNHFHDMLSERCNGEAILFESRGGDVSTVTPLSSILTLLAPRVAYVKGDAKDRQRQTVAIISGTGKGQYRVISSSSGGIHFLETPWEITPDSTSKVLFSQCPTDCSFVFNRFSDTVGGINLYGNAFGCSLNSNWLRNSHEGITLNTSWDDGAKSVSQWHSLRSNIFEDSVGHHFVAPRATADTHPQIAFINSFENLYFGQVSNSLWASQGSEFGANDESKLAAPTIDFVSDLYSNSYTDRQKYAQQHKVLVPFVMRPIWRRTVSGIGNIIVGGHAIDDVRVKDGVIEAVVR